MEQQEREQRPRTSATERHLGPVVTPDLQRAEQPELHTSGSSRNVLSIGRPVERAETVECEPRCLFLPQHQARVVVGTTSASGMTARIFARTGSK